MQNSTTTEEPFYGNRCERFNSCEICIQNDDCAWHHTYWYCDRYGTDDGYKGRRSGGWTTKCDGYDDTLNVAQIVLIIGASLIVLVICIGLLFYCNRKKPQNKGIYL